jgi:hypothetical protein
MIFSADRMKDAVLRGDFLYVENAMRVFDL